MDNTTTQAGDPIVIMNGPIEGRVFDAFEGMQRGDRIRFPVRRESQIIGWYEYQLDVLGLYYIGQYSASGD